VQFTLSSHSRPLTNASDHRYSSENGHPRSPWRSFYRGFLGTRSGRGPPERWMRPELQAMSNSLQLT